MDQSTQDTDRDIAVRRVMRSVTRRVIHTPLPVMAADGSFPVIVALPDDTLGSIEVRRDRINRDVNILVAYSDRMVVIAMRDGVSDDAAPVDPDSSVDMLVTWLRTTSDAKPAIRVVRSLVEVEDMAYSF